MKIEGNNELQRETLRALLHLTEDSEQGTYHRPSSIAKNTDCDPGDYVYPYYVARFLKPYIDKGLVEKVSIPFGKKKAAQYRANLSRRKEIEKELSYSEDGDSHEGEN